MERFGAGAGERDTANENIVADGPGNATQHVGLIGVLVFHTEINQDSCFILLNGIVVELFYSRVLVGVNKFKRGPSNELMGFEAEKFCNRVGHEEPFRLLREIDDSDEGKTGGGGGVH